MPSEDSLRFAFKAGVLYAKSNRDQEYDEEAAEKGFKAWHHMFGRLDEALKPKDVIAKAARIRKLQKLKTYQKNYGEDVMDDIAMHLAMSGDQYEEKCEAELWLAIFKEVGVIKDPT